MTIASLLDSPSELTDTVSSKTAVVLMTRIRLARNVAGNHFPGWAKPAQRAQTYGLCRDAVLATTAMKKSLAVEIGDLSELEKQILVERHLISRELSGGKNGSGVVISKDQCFSVMINEEDHLRIQVLRAGFQLKKAWSAINELDTAIEDRLDYAFSPSLGYLTACPTNIGTGLRASAMMHLPALVIANQMEKVVRAVNQLGMVVRGLFGEGSDASGSIFQISNQTTLGESEDEIIKRLGSVLTSIVEHELNARQKLIEADRGKLFDKIGRAYGILQNSHVLSSGEAMNLLSLLRLGVDLHIFPEENRATIDRLFIEAQPGHLQHAQKGEFEPNQRDLLRAGRLRTEFANFPQPNFTFTTDGSN
ncbi:protein arginine kinase [Opitutus terrae]|uniref:ATP:guanido phosphotransferase n=1 Tax=Opitutus terrae (strain DSM 11246 / JCM 15787 / PB90-1) TaxID=452637 RepID=B1ZUY8_OPITP|nr:protein arginine kinase [Opitutus terrae]ACB75958.1 ATP:guanido phosphotransferase [Opitutus terrae PB90-1]